MTIDWTKPIETVPDERNPVPVACRLLRDSEVGSMWGGTNPDRHGHYWVDASNEHICTFADGTQDTGVALFRNVAQPEAVSDTAHLRSQLEQALDILAQVHRALGELERRGAGGAQDA